MFFIIVFSIIVTALLSILLYLSYVLIFAENNWRSKYKLIKKGLTEEKKKHLKKEQLLKRKVYQAEVLRELSDRTGYSLNVPRIVEVITGSLGEVLDYHTTSYMLFKKQHIEFHCFVSQSINHLFVKDLQKIMLEAFSAMLDKNLSDKYIEEIVSGTVLDDTAEGGVNSFFNLPLIIQGRIVGLINVASPKKGLYTEEETKILYTITQQASSHYEKLKKLLEKEKRKLNAMVSSMADGVIMLDKKMRMVVFNPAAKKMLDLKKIEKPTILDIANSLSGKVDLRTKLDKALKENTVVEQKDIFLKNTALHLLISPVKDNNEEKIGSVILFRNVTAEKELEKMREEFTAMMVHELRAPLTTIKGTTDMIINEKRVSQEAKNNLLQTMKEDSEHMLDLVGDLLDVAKIEAGKFQIEPTPSDIKETVEKAVVKFSPQAKQKGLQIKTQLEEKLPKVEHDQLRISQVLNNVLSNAIKYTEKGFIKVVLEKKEKEIYIKVKDMGAGMTETELSGLFSKFKQFGKGKSGKIKGTGLGLVIAKGIVEAHSGKIWAESDGPGKGSAFTFSLPVKRKKVKKGGE